MQNTEANIVSVVVGVIQHPQSKKYLITRRQKGQHLAGLWEFPGGKVENDEPLFLALQRELFEEVGIKLISATPLKKIIHHYDEKSVSLNFWISSQFDNIAESKEGQSLKWVSFDELAYYDFPEANQAIIDSLALPCLWKITDNCDMLSVDQFIENNRQSVQSHQIKQLLFRSKQLSYQDYMIVAERLEKVCAQQQCRLILNHNELGSNKKGSWHLTSQQLFEIDERPEGIDFLSASCHCLDDIKQAEKLKLDCILLSPVNHTLTHPDAKPIGWSEFKKIAEKTSLPVYALGGVGKEDLTTAQYHGAKGIAGIRCFL